ncbi:Signal transduction histidine kinase [Chitinophaga sp. CF118]|uniref:ligand-binding sensor domain-containing protein n=1 Tax=Chitinophaga sp. CF118 TaxID=1884367 RepID=UPI0008F1717C|nr:sensor histidine kinase [Chitinophaga sp. CF118]SFD74565.1 Signal transduction histidine kinase [Chitinophaga sp. CF118]
MKITLLLCFSLLQIGQVFAKPEQEPYEIQHFSDQDGLPQNSVKDIAPDEHGFLWLSTENGLVRFDGYRFLNFNGSNLPIKDSHIHFIYPNAKRNGILAKTIMKEVLTIHNGSVNLLMPASRDFGYLSYNDATDNYSVTGLPDFFLNVSGANHYLIPLESDSYFKISKDTIRFFKGDVERYRTAYPHLNPANFFTLQGQLCYLKENGQLTLFNQGGAHMLNLTGDLSQSKKGGLIWNFAAGQVFIYVAHSCYRLQFSDASTIRSTLVLKDFDFYRNGIATVYHDEQHNRVFLGSITKGLYIYTKKQFRGLKAGGEDDEVYYAQAPYGKNSIVTPRGVIFDSTGKTTRLPLLSQTSVPDNYSITPDLRGNYWYKNGAKLFGFNSDFTAILSEQNLHDKIDQLYADKDGRLWIGMKTKGLYFLRTKDVNPQPQLYSAEVKDVTYMILDNQNILWTGTGNGLYRVDLSAHKVDTIPGLSNRYIRSLYIPTVGEVWITTYNHGVSLYKDGRLIHLPLDQKGYMATAHCIVRDDQGFLWITTNKGLFQVSYEDAISFAKGAQKTLFYLYYGKEQGFNTNEFNGGCQPCALNLQNGDISLPSLDGLVYFTPSKIWREVPENKIFIDRVELDAKKIDAENAVFLPNNFHHLKLSISTPYFGDPNNLHIYYSLESAGKNDPELWLPVSDSRIIEFSSLPSGKYNLRIRKLNGFGKENIMEKVFVIQVEQAFYETIWFRILVGILMLLTAFAFSWFRVRKVEQKNRILELHVLERTRELKETLDNLKISEQQLRRQGFIQQRLITAISHDLRTPLKYLLQVIGKGSKIDTDEQNIIHESLYGMYYLVENLIQYMKSQFISDDSSLEMVDLWQVLEEKANIFRPVSQTKEVAIINQTLPGTLVLVNRQLLAIVIHNLLDNAVKYTKKGSIQLKASSDDEKIHIQFIDTGIGMPPQVINWINQYRKETPIMEGKPSSYDGIGLLMVVELLQLINGNIMITPNIGNGTIIDITLDVIK